MIFRMAGIAQLTAPNVLRIATDGAMDTLLVSETVRYFAPTLSPDGRFLAYVSTGSGPPLEVYVRNYPALDRVWPISVGGGSEPVWSPDGQRLYYKSLPDAATLRPAVLVSVPFDSTSADFLQSDPLFPLPEGVTSGTTTNYAVDRDDQRFLMLRYGRPGEEEESYHVVNGFAELVRARVTR